MNDNNDNNNNNEVKNAKESAAAFLPAVNHSAPFLPIDDMASIIKSTIIGQDEAVSKILLSLYCSNYLNKVPCVTLIIGPSGCGKTETITQICKYMDLAYTIETATQYTQEGYVGSSVDAMLANLIANSSTKDKKVDRYKAEHGILFIDEIGKKAGKNSSDRDVSGREVLNSLLPILSGQTVNITTSRQIIQFNCSHLKIFLADAFVGLDEIREKRLNMKSIGFQSSKQISKEDFSPEKSPYTKADLIEYGLPPEFVGRINKIVVMNNMTVDVLEQIAQKSDASLYGILESNLKKIFNITLSTENNFNIFEEIAKATLNFGTGARELNNTINYVFEKIFHKLFNLDKNIYYYRECILLPGITSDNSRFVLVPADV